MNFLKIIGIVGVLFAIMLLKPVLVLGNVGIFEGFGQSVRLETSAKVQMVSEEVDIYLLRAGGPVSGSLDYRDRARYICKFILKNLTNEAVTVSTGFPLSSEYINTIKDTAVNQAELISSYNFVAGTETGSYSIKYLPYDTEKKYGDIFIWSMVFKPNETINLLVSYEINGYTGLGNSARNQNADPEKIFPGYLDSLTSGFLKIFGYVTTTGKSWTGKIEVATFRIHLGGFEDYLVQRGAFEALPMDPNHENDRIEFPTLVRDVQPADWTEIRDNKMDRTLVKEYSNFEPEQDIMISYLFCSIPTNVAEYQHYIQSTRENAQENLNRMTIGMQKLKAKENATDEKKRIAIVQRYISENEDVLSPVGEKDIADAILEFYGYETQNQRIAPFLNEQTWYPINKPPEMDQELKEHLLQKP